jgi:signal transduction histidine kinase
MSERPVFPDFPGMEFIDLHGNSAFLDRPLRSRAPHLEVDAIRSLAQIFPSSPTKILRELVNSAVSVCSAESAGISLEEIRPSGEVQFRWIATAGLYAPYLDAVLPAFFAPCRTCLDRRQSQHFHVTREYLDSIAVDAPAVLDGILIPWQADSIRGTIWVLCHTSERFFDREDVRILQSLSWFAAIAVRHQAEQRQLRDEASARATTAFAREFAHLCSGPLQSLTNLIQLLNESPPMPLQDFTTQADQALLRINQLIQELLNLPRPD